jgi:ketosteroid isomerase-like protein
MSSKLELIKRYLRFIESLKSTPAGFPEFLHPEVKFTEFPNLVNVKGQVRDLAAAIQGSEMGKKILANQHFELKQHYECGETVVVETDWSGTLAVEAGPFKKGQVLKAFICMIVEFRDDKIYRQRNYDCYEPF